MRETDTKEAAALMRRFAIATGLTRERPPRRYLWTDAHAVCNFLSLERRTGDGVFRERAIALVEQVHQTLGRHRPDDTRSGWISGLDDAASSAHPTAGGLRIGKGHPERRADEPFREAAEWDRDGQYYHYLTRWMHALTQIGRATGDASYFRWAAELGAVALRGFMTRAGPPRLYWKMSIDLSRPLVGASGHHDPLDGLVTAISLVEADARTGTDLNAVVAELSELCRGRSWYAEDPLGIGGLLFDAARITRMSGDMAGPARAQLIPILDAVAAGLATFVRSGSLRSPAGQRLAFRELGLAIGLRALDPISKLDVPAAARTRVDTLAAYRRVGREIEEFWLRAEHRRVPSWVEHEDINDVMLATALVPDAFLPD